MATFKSRAVRIEQHGGPEQMRVVEVEVGEPGPGEVRIPPRGMRLCAAHSRDVVYRALATDGGRRRGWRRGPR